MLVVYSRRSSRMLPTWRSRSCWKSFANIFPLTSSWWRPIPRLWPPGRETFCCSCKLRSSNISSCCLFFDYNSFFHLAPESTFSAMRVRPQQREPRIADVLQLCLRCALCTQSKIVQEFISKYQGVIQKALNRSTTDHQPPPQPPLQLVQPSFAHFSKCEQLQS